ncbi:MAG: class I SAM-dependent methyltransferase [Candidatus Kryptoniota bacterium]
MSPKIEGTAAHMKGRSRIFFGPVAKYYDEWYSSPLNRYAERIEDYFLFEVFKDLSGSILEVGCGTGNYLKKLSHFVNMVGLDYSMDMLEICVRKTSCPLVNGRAESLPFKDGSFDIVFAMTAVEFFDDIEKGLHEIVRVSSKHIILAFLSKPSLMHFTRKIANIFTRNEFSFYNPQNPRKLISFLLSKYHNLKLVHRSTTLLLYPIYFKKAEKFLEFLDIRFSWTNLGGFSVLYLKKE